MFTTNINIKGLERLNQGATSITDADDYNYWLIKFQGSVSSEDAIQLQTEIDKIKVSAESIYITHSASCILRSQLWLIRGEPRIQE